MNRHRKAFLSVMISNSKGDLSSSKSVVLKLFLPSAPAYLRNWHTLIGWLTTPPAPRPVILNKESLL